MFLLLLQSNVLMTANTNNIMRHLSIKVSCVTFRCLVTAFHIQSPPFYGAFWQPRECDVNSGASCQSIRRYLREAVHVSGRPWRQQGILIKENDLNSATHDVSMSYVWRAKRVQPDCSCHQVERFSSGSDIDADATVVVEAVLQREGA